MDKYAFRQNDYTIQLLKMSVQWISGEIIGIDIDILQVRPDPICYTYANIADFRNP